MLCIEFSFPIYTISLLTPSSPPNVGLSSNSVVISSSTVTAPEISLGSLTVMSYIYKHTTLDLSQKAEK
ncbi:hypothetical protein RJ639_018644, partial [Escallonia herrerae]